jgi:N-acetylglucosamine kinase-like BadF-type ATPase
MRVIGVDAGGTKTVCYLADQTGTVLAEARGPGAHINAVGSAGVQAILQDVIGAVLAESPGELTAICLGMAGVDRPGEMGLIRGLLERVVSVRHVVIVNDALVALEAGAPAEAGVVLIAGTGSIAYGRDAHGRAARAGGWGYVLADEGSGYWLGRQALRSVMRQADGRGPETALTELLLERYNVSRALELVRTIYSSDLKPAGIASLAATVEAAAAAGDRVAQGIIEMGARELTDAAVSVARRLALSRFPVVLSGGIFRVVHHMRAAVSAEISARLPDARIEPLSTEPAMGAVRLALRAAAGERVLPEYLGDGC